MKKKMISIRLEPKLLKLLDRVSETPNTIYTSKDRTWLIESAIREQYKMYRQNGSDKVEN